MCYVNNLILTFLYFIELLICYKFYALCLAHIPDLIRVPLALNIHTIKASTAKVSNIIIIIEEDVLAEYIRNLSLC